MTHDSGFFLCYKIENMNFIAQKKPHTPSNEREMNFMIRPALKSNYLLKNSCCQLLCSVIS